MKQNNYYTCLVQMDYPGPTGTIKLSRVVTIPEFPFITDADDEDCVWEEELMDQLLLQLKALEIANFLKCSQKKDIMNKAKDQDILQKLKHTNSIPMLYRIRFNATNVVVTVIEHIEKNGEIESDVLLEEWHPFLKKN